jgi:hypothetical protein
MLGIDSDSYHVVMWITSNFSGHVSIWWLNRKQHAANPSSCDSLVDAIRKTSLLPNIRDDAINALLRIAQGNLSFATYTQMFNDFLRRSRQPLTDDLHCVRCIGRQVNFEHQTQAKSHRSQRKGYNLPLVELQNLLNDLVTNFATSRSC